MPSHLLENSRIVSQRRVPSPLELHQEVPATELAAKTVLAGRAQLEAILDGTDSRFFVVMGPCSIHDPVAAIEYAHRLKELADEVQEKLLLVMRVYFEKPRTTTGWKGLINDPGMDDSFDVVKGLRMARKLMLDINELGLPLGTEALDPLTPQYLGDLVSWSAIGARTTESQTHREMASGLSSPVGFKNGTDGGLQVAVNAMLAAASPHAFLGVDFEGKASLTQTAGNPYGHLILRGGSAPNYDSVCVAQAEQSMSAAGLPSRIVVDCSHGNSLKKPELQPLVLRDVANQRKAGSLALVGAMLESHLVFGSQKLLKDRGAMVFGQSVTDACLGWGASRDAILGLANTLA